MKSKHEKKVVISSPPQLQSCPSGVNAIVKNPPQVTEEIGTGKAATLEGILSAPPSPGPPPPPRPNLPSPSSRPHVYTSPTPITPCNKHEYGYEHEKSQNNISRSTLQNGQL